MLPFPTETPSSFVILEIFRDPAAVKINVSRFPDSIVVSLVILLPLGPQGAIQKVGLRKVYEPGPRIPSDLSF